jgi:hypothetical protein
VTPFDWKYHCATLGVSEQATLAEMKDAYRKLAHRFHPDHNAGTQEAKERFQRLNQSYQFLTKNFQAHSAANAAQAPPAAPAPPKTSHNAAADEKKRAENAPSLRWGWRKPAGSMRNAGKIPFLALLLSSPIFRPLLVAAPPLMALIFFGVSVHNAGVVETKLPPNYFEATKAVKESPANVPRARCEMFSFLQGILVSKTKYELSEAECGLKCDSWIGKYQELDASCQWNAREIANHVAPPAPRLPASPALPPASLAPSFYLNAIPELIDNPLTVFHDVKLGSEIRETLPFIPQVYIENYSYLHGNMGLNPKQIIITPIRKGVTGVVFVNPNGLDSVKIVYNIN